MSFTAPAAGIWLGLAALGGLLAVLQILRVRHREVPVVTTLFWRQALEDTRARVFLQRFRHPAAWLLFFAICALLWLAWAGPRWGGRGDERVVCLLDHAAATTSAEGFEAAKARLLADVPGLPAATTHVLLVGGPAHALLEPGEDPIQLTPRLRTSKVVQAPSHMAEVIRQLAAESTEPLTVRVYGEAPLPPARSLPGHVTVVRATSSDSDADRPWRLGALGQAPAASGRADAVDLLVALRGPAGSPAPAVVVGTDAGPLAGSPTRTSDGAGHVRLRFADVRADGRVVHVRLSVADDPLGSIVLADRPALRVSVHPTLRAYFAPVLDADPGLVLVDEDPDVSIVTGLPGDDAPALAVVAAAEAGHAIGVTATEADADRVLERLERDLALAEIDGAALAQGTGRVISVGASAGARRAISLWRPLLAPEAGFTSSRAFPLFVAKALRWLADREPLHAFVAAGERLPTARVRGYEPVVEHASPQWRPLDPVAAAFTPPFARRYAAADGAEIHASLLDPGLSDARRDDDARRASAASAPPSLAALFLLAALLLLGLEWFLFRTGRVP